MNAKQSGGETKPTIFVVDDEPMLLDLAVMILEPLGFHVRTFRDPRMALKEFAAAEQPPGIIITDYAMHTMTGTDFIRECRHVNPRQKIILMSGTVSEDIYATSPAKPDHFLAKPYQAAELVGAVRQLTAKQ